jgi:hypothetical protein
LAQSRRAIIRDLLARVEEPEMRFTSTFVDSCEALLLGVMAVCQLGMVIVVLDITTEHRASGNSDLQEAHSDEPVIETIVVRG